MSLINFLSSIKNKRITAQLDYVNNYKKVNKCKFIYKYHDNGLMIIDTNKNICILDLIVTM
jgi:hypothetical protein